MKSTRLQRLLLLLIALWLPLQSLAAVGMASDGHAAAAAAQAADPAAEDACPLHDGTAEQAPVQDCERCGVCHLAAAGYLPMPAAAPPGLPPAGRDFLALAVTALTSHTPEPPQHPPKA